MRTMFLNGGQLGLFLLCFWLIVHPKGHYERVRIGFSANVLGPVFLAPLSLLMPLPFLTTLSLSSILN